MFAGDDFLGKPSIEETRAAEAEKKRKADLKKQKDAAKKLAKQAAKKAARASKPKSGTIVYGKDYWSETWGGDIIISMNITGIKSFASKPENLVKRATADRRKEISEFAIKQFEPYVPKRTGALAKSAKYNEDLGAIEYDVESKYKKALDPDDSSIGTYGFHYANIQYQADWFNHPNSALETDHWDKVAWQNGAVRAAIVHKAEDVLKKRVRSLSK